MHARRRSLRTAMLAGMALIATGAMLGSGLTVASAAVPTGPVALQQRTDAVVTADPLPTVQIDSGVVWAQTTIGTTVYAVGSFSNARAPLAAPGTSLTPRSNILAFDIRTGALLAFSPQVNGAIRSVAASPDGSRLYIGGSFSSVNGQTRWNFAALDAATGALAPGFTASIGGTGVYGIAVRADSVYLTGLFTQANGVARKNLAAFATANGALRSWAPTTDRQGDAIVVEPGGQRIIVGGRFYLTNDVVQRGLVALHPVTGAIDTAWLAPRTVVNGWSSGTDAGKAGIYALTTDSSGVYGTGWSFAPAAVGNLEGVFAAEPGSGAIRWIADCHGDHYGVYSTGDVVYTTSHNHQCETVGLNPELSPRQARYASAFTASAQGTLTRSPSAGSKYKDWSGTPAPAPYAWYPDFAVGRATAMGEAGLSITGAGAFISVAGEFPSVNNQRYQGIVRFSTAPPSGPKQGPRIASAAWGAPTATSNLAGRVRISIPGNWDRDDRDLTYELRRSGTAGVLASKTLSSPWWWQPRVTFDDTGLPPGAAYTYTVRAVDGDGNAVTSPPVTVTVAGSATSAYASAVLDDGATLQYPLGADRTDWAGAAAPVFGSAVQDRAPGAVAGATGASASAFDGTSLSRVTSPTPHLASPVFSTELWFRTTTTTGGKLIGFGNALTGSSASADRHIYMQNNGRLTFGVRPAEGIRTISSSAAYNDGRWHHAVATQGPGGTALYVDGVQVARDTAVISAQTYSGVWRIGGDTVAGWPSAPTSAYFNGEIDEVAVYESALTSGRVAAHYALGQGRAAPTAAFTSTTTGTLASFNASGSTADAGATIASYAWDFGDGTAGTGVTPSRTYAAPGTYAVTLTVTDSRGATASVTRDVVISAPNTAPSPSFTTSVDGLSVAVNAASSTDADGRIVSYAWSWGDGTAAGSGVTASHAYASAGTRTITLTVTDDDGATATRTASVTVQQPPATTFAASDDFGRTVSSGWGTADRGGVWSMLSGTAAPASVANGTGRLTLGAGSTRNIVLAGTPLRDTRTTLQFSLDQAPPTGSSYVGVVARGTATDSYTARVWLRDTGAVWLVLQHGSTVLRSQAVPGLTRAAGDSFSLAVEVRGTTSTTISASVWRTGTAQPAAWQATATDTAPSGSGAVGVHANRASTATTTGIFTVDAFRVTDLG